MLAKDYSCYKIGKELGFAGTSVLKYIEKLGLSTSHKSTHLEVPIKTYKDDIIKMFCEEGISATQIAVKYDCDVHRILIILQDNGIDTTRKLIPVNDKYFEKIDTIDKAYCVGLFYTDGYNGGNHIKLKITDEDIVEKCKKHIGYEGRIYKCKGAKEGYKEVFNLTINRPKMAEDLTKLGCPPRKTFTITYPTENILPRNLESHFIRGALDGDGCVSRNYINWTGMEAFVVGISNVLKRELDIDCHIYTNENVKNLMICRTEDRIKLIRWLYKDSTEDTRGDRKYNLAVQYHLS
jgi:hypothetical protein